MEFAIVFEICLEICSELCLQKESLETSDGRKRKFTGNKYTREANLKDNPIKESDNGDVTRAKETKRQFSDRAEVRSLPASIGKLDEDSGNSQESSNEWEPEEPEGFPFIDIAVLAEVFRSLWCPLCRYGHIVFEEDQNSKKGFRLFFS